MEVNQDLLNQFKKRNSGSDNKINLEENKLTSSIGMKRNSELKKEFDLKNKENVNSGNKKIDNLLRDFEFSSPKERSSTPSIITSPISVSNSFLEDSKNATYNAKPVREGASNNNVVSFTNSRPNRSFLASNHELENRNNSIDKKVAIDSKKMNLLETLSVTPSNKHTHSHNKYTQFVSLNTSNISNKSIDEKKHTKGIKEKIKDFVLEIDKKKEILSSQTVLNSGYNFNSNTNLNQSRNSRDNIYEFNNKTNINTINNKDDNKKISSSSLSDLKFTRPKFSINSELKNKKLNALFNESSTDKQKSTEKDDFFQFNIKETKSENRSTSRLNAEEIKKISNQIRFLSSEEIRRLDEK